MTMERKKELGEGRATQGGLGVFLSIEIGQWEGKDRFWGGEKKVGNFRGEWLTEA